MFYGINDIECVDCFSKLAIGVNWFSEQPVRSLISTRKFVKETARDNKKKIKARESYFHHTLSWSSWKIRGRSQITELFVVERIDIILK